MGNITAERPVERPTRRYLTNGDLRYYKMADLRPDANGWYALNKAYRLVEVLEKFTDEDGTVILRVLYETAASSAVTP